MRSLLLVAATDRPGLDAALASAADVAILDLADLVAPEAKAEARGAMVACLAAQASNPARPRLYVRINGFSSGFADLDLDAAVAAGAEGIVLPRAGGGPDVTRLDAKIAVAEAIHGIPDGRTRIVASVAETAHGVFQVGSHRGASHRLAGLVWDPEALARDLGAAATRAPDGTLHDAFRQARTATLLGAVAAEVVAIDAAWTGAADGLVADCTAAARDGFTAKLAVHPGQVAAINAAFTPSPAAVAEAAAVVEAFRASGGTGAVAFRGRSLERPQLMRALATLARAGRS
ncbi:CoA ester lyase [Siculibacillus lacustris]|uniref:CoA ester lyase n=1 Tax=Siculibacillus lacustris TaxID=1549641 RepID=A0A4Q9VI48_9HYPH|nr:aldolase/citrate lyase family protein [Siculibacillus lacustris]TBW34621.1 CoA ester lyase [Siculibacillus lacustris]